jgi:hypothetical protein
MNDDARDELAPAPQRPPAAKKVLMLSTLAAVALMTMNVDENTPRAPRLPPPEPSPPPPPATPTGVSPETLALTWSAERPNIARDFARHQAIERDRRAMEAAKEKQARKAAKRLRDAARRSR